MNLRADAFNTSITNIDVDCLILKHRDLLDLPDISNLDDIMRSMENIKIKLRAVCIEKRKQQYYFEYFLMEWNKIQNDGIVKPSITAKQEVKQDKKLNVVEHHIDIPF
jgi:hypothetical protein